MPMIVAVPPGRSDSKHCSAVRFKPTASNENSTPPPVSSLIASTGSALDALITSVAPISFATSSLEEIVSTAMMRSAPAMAAPLTADRPIPPQSNTATVAPGGTFAVFITAPAPVMTPHPTSAATFSGISSASFTTAFSCTSNCSANEDRLANCPTVLPFQNNRCALPGGIFTSALEHRLGRPVVQYSQVPQKTERQVITRSPGLTYVTSLPTASTTAEDSWPRTTGVGIGYSPSRKCRSL